MPALMLQLQHLRTGDLKLTWNRQAGIAPRWTGDADLMGIPAESTLHRKEKMRNPRCLMDDCDDEDCPLADRPLWSLRRLFYGARWWLYWTIWHGDEMRYPS